MKIEAKNQATDSIDDLHKLADLLHEIYFLRAGPRRVEIYPRHANA